MSRSLQKFSQQKLILRHREEVTLIVLLKTLFENLNLVESYDETHPIAFVFSLWEKYK